MWPAVVAAVALLVLAIAIPAFAFWIESSNVQALAGEIVTPADQQFRQAWLFAGASSGIIAIVLAIVALIGSRSVGPRVTAGAAILLGLLVAGVLGLAGLTATPPLPPAPGASASA